ncbi:MAG: glycoside hydrolase family 13 protein [bacterium]|nr:glycoside hydrolase family 13 protein [bacterium]
MRTPGWARGAVWYQIFPERFCNGDVTNDPEARWLERPGITGWKVRRWTREWYATDEWEERIGGLRSSIWHRRYGGDLAGIRQKLDYLQQLGVTALYLTPVFMARSAHKYDGASYHHVDPYFGPDPAGDFAALAAVDETEDPRTWIWTRADRALLDLINDVHARGMRIILDGVFNHTGRECFAFKDLLRHGRKSPYANWYRIEEWNDALPHGFKVAGWFGHASLPELARDHDTLAAPVRQYIFNAVRRWMDPHGNGDVQAGVDGWRLDVAFCVPHGFWKEFRAVVKGINPEAYLTGEVIEVAPAYLQGDEFDALMNYPWLTSVVEFFVDRRTRISVETFDRRLREVRNAYPAEATAVMQNLLDSHDTARLATMLMNPDGSFRDWGHYHQFSQALKNARYNVRKPTRDARRRQRLIVLFQMTYLGAPMIYYGDEVGMWGGNDPCCRKPMVWRELTYEAETRGPDGEAHEAEEVVCDDELYDWYRKLIALRRNSPALCEGRFETVLCDNQKQVYVFKREHLRETAVVALNNNEQAVQLDRRALGLTESAVSALTHSRIGQRLVLQPVSGDVFLTRNPGVPSG